MQSQGKTCRKEARRRGLQTKIAYAVIQGLSVSHTILFSFHHMYLFLSCIPTFFPPPHVYMRCFVHFFLFADRYHDVQVEMKACLHKGNYDPKSVLGVSGDLLISKGRMMFNLCTKNDSLSRLLSVVLNPPSKMYSFICSKQSKQNTQNTHII